MTTDHPGPGQRPAVHHDADTEHKILDVADASQVERLTDEKIINEHPEIADHTEKVKFKTWLAIIFMSIDYACMQGLALIPLNVISLITLDLGQPVLGTWIGSGYGISLGVGILIANTMSDLLGRRWFILLGTVVVSIGALVGALAKNTATVVAGQVLIGIGQGGVSVTISAAGELVPKKYRPYVIGGMNTLLGIWIVSGSLIGHKLAVATGPGWRSVFWLIFAVGLACTIGVALTYFPATPLASFRKSGQSFLKYFDWVGLAGIVSVQVLISLGITYVQSYGPKSARFLVPFIIGVVLIVPTALWEMYVAKNPLLHPALFKRVRTFSMMCVIGLVGGMLFYSIEVFFATLLQTLYDGDDQVQIGVDNIPFAIGTNTGGVSAALLLPVLGPMIGTHVMLSIGVALQVLFIPLLCIAGLGSSGKAMTLAFSFFGGFGIGVMELLTILLVQYSAPDEYLGFAYGILGLFRGIGGSAGTSIYVTIFTSEAATAVPAYVAKAAVTAGLPQESLPLLLGILTGVVKEPLTAVNGITPEIIGASVVALREAYRHSFRYVWLAAIPFGIIALICAAVSRDLSDQLTNKTPQHLKNVVQKEDVERENAREMVIASEDARKASLER